MRQYGIPEGFTEGKVYRVSGTPLHNGHLVTVVNPTLELSKNRDKTLGGNGQLRHGLVAAHDPAFPTTLWWWFAPHQLKSTDS